MCSTVRVTFYLDIYQLSLSLYNNTHPLQWVELYISFIFQNYARKSCMTMPTVFVKRENFCSRITIFRATLLGTVWSRSGVLSDFIFKTAKWPVGVRWLCDADLGMNVSIFTTDQNLRICTLFELCCVFLWCGTCHFIHVLQGYSTHWGRDKWPPFRGRYFQMHFLEWKLCILIRISLDFIS